MGHLSVGLSGKTVGACVGSPQRLSQREATPVWLADFTYRHDPTFTSTLSFRTTVEFKEIKLDILIFQVLAATSMKMVSWDVAPCSLVKIDL
jgi:hypothetical protein